MDRIELKGIQAKGFHGVYPEEKVGQVFIVDAILWVDLSVASRTDELTDTVHYGELAEQINGFITGQAYALIERLGGAIADDVMERYPTVVACEITVHKPQAPIVVEFSDVSVVIRRSRFKGASKQ